MAGNRSLTKPAIPVSKNVRMKKITTGITRLNAIQSVDEPDLIVFLMDV
jgi:hypothetical protein